MVFPWYTLEGRDGDSIHTKGPVVDVVLTSYSTMCGVGIWCRFFIEHSTRELCGHTRHAFFSSATEFEGER